MKIIVVGDGKWGSAIGSLLSENGREFSFWKKGDDLPDQAILIMCIPTQAIREVLTLHGKNLKNIIYINGAKGIEKVTHKLPYQIAMDILGKNIDYFSLIGPSFAEEVEEKMPTLVNIGYVKEQNAELIRDLFHTDYFRVRLTRGIRALAIACGVAEGLGFKTNTRVKLILLAIEEFYRLSRKLGYTIDRRALPGTIGDLILTCNSEESRNFSFGKLLAKHKKGEALSLIGETVEGYSSVESVPYFEEHSRINLPLARFAYEIIREDDPAFVRSGFSDFVKNS